MEVLISGSGGFIGRALCRRFVEAGHRVRRLVRRPPRDGSETEWNPAEPPRPDTLGAPDVVVHLAGAGIADGRWTAARMHAIRESRVAGTRRLLEGLHALAHPPRAFLCASATGIYGGHGSEPVDETAEPGRGFLAGVCREWETTARTGSPSGTRVVLLRFGMVLDPEGGALARMLPLFRLGLGGRLGDGRFFMPWIDRPDACAAILRLAADESLSGPFNLTAPAPVTNRVFTRTLARALHRPAPWPVPGVLLHLVFGRMASEVLLQGVRALPERLEAADFRFAVPTLDACFRRIFHGAP